MRLLPLQHLCGALPGGFSDCSHRCRRVSVFQLISGKRRDYSFQVATDSIRENTAFNMCDDRLVGFVDSIRTKTGDETRQNRFVLIGSAFIRCSGCEFWKVSTRNELRKVAVRVEHEDPFGVGTPSVVLFAIWMHIER